MDTGAGGASDQSAKVVRVLHTVQNEKRAGFDRIATNLKDVVKFGIGKGFNLESYTLMMFACAHPGNIDLFPGVDRNPLFRGYFEQFFKPFIVDAAGQIKFICYPVAAESFKNRVYAIE
jgi:hypothetical protein